jgi:hypothetical protein
MADDFYGVAANHRMQMLAAEEQAALADLAAFRANNDTESAAGAVQQLANLRAERANLVELHNAYVASQQPPPQPELSDEEKLARPWHRMTPQDALDLAKTSKYGKDLNFNDAHVRAGWHEAQRRKARGE